MAARRGRPVSHIINGLDCPTERNPAIEIKAENPALPNLRDGSPGQHIAPAHKRMARMLGYTLTLGSFEDWLGFAFVAAVRLSIEERAALAYAALRSLEPRQAEAVAATALDAAGMPGASFTGEMAEARFWAERATPAERKAYALAAFEQLAPAEQAAFFQHIGTMEVMA